MFDWINFFQLEKVSFLIGFITATLFWWIFTKTLKWWPDLVASIKKLRENLRKNQTSGVEIAVRKNAITRSQSNHIGAKLFSLNEICITPKLLIPPNQLIANENSPFLGEILTLIPYTPDVPIISRNFNVPKVNITDAVQKGMNLAISGSAGCGKTFALAYLAFCLADKSPLLGKSSAKIPFYFHIHDTEILTTPGQSLPSVIYKALSSYLPVSQLPKLARFIEYQLEAQNAILIIDGLDELKETDFLKVIRFLENVIPDHSGVQFILAVSPHYLGPLERMGLLVLPLAEMSNSETAQLQRKWIDLWYEHIFEKGEKSIYFLKKDLLKNWTTFNTPGLTPLENTLYIWGALSGEIRGHDTFSIYESLFSRIFQSGYSPDALASIAIEFIESKSTALPAGKIEGALTDPLIEWGILSKKSDLLVFTHMDLLAFLASMSPRIFEPENSIELEVRDPLNFLYSGYISARQPHLFWLDELISAVQPPLYLNLLLLGPWLRHVPIKTTWRINLFKSLVQIIQNPLAPFAIKLRLLSTFIYANDPSLQAFVRQLLAQNDATFKHLALILIGMHGMDPSLITDLIAMLENANSITKKYIVLALSAFDEEQSYHALATLLLHSDEDIRKLVAECLSHMGSQGIEILKDAITLEDILVRRSAIFGLVNVNEFWVMDILNKLSIEDSQWVVRNVAHQAVEHLNTGLKFLPDPSIPLYEEEWLIQFAANQNLGISPEVNATPLLLKVLVSGNDTEKLKAMSALPTVLESEPDPTLYLPLNEKNLDISGSAVNMLWRIFQSGYELPVNPSAIL